MMKMMTMMMMMMILNRWMITAAHCYDNLGTLLGEEKAPKVRLRPVT